VRSRRHRGTVRILKSPLTRKTALAVLVVILEHVGQRKATK
jgi:hypothetical protein